MPNRPTLQTFTHEYIFIIFYRENHTQTSLRLYHILFHSIIQHKYMLQWFLIQDVMVLKVNTGFLDDLIQKVGVD